jgi:hypothetical protein
MKYSIALEGTKPLLMHNARLANPMDPYAKAMKEISGKRKKTEDDHAELARREFQGGLYYDEKLGPCIPERMLFATMVEGARLLKRGRDVERGFIGFDAANYALDYDGPRDRDALYEDVRFVDVRSVKVGQARVMRTRPIFPEWSVEFEVEFDSAIIDPDVLTQILENAGRYIGLGEFRKLYGRFTADVEAA